MSVSQQNISHLNANQITLLRQTNNVSKLDLVPKKKQRCLFQNKEAIKLRLYYQQTEITKNCLCVIKRNGTYTYEIRTS